MKAEKRSQWRRWRIFNLVGLVGFSVQLLTLFFLKSVAGLDYRVATACAVQIAVLHNFIWHEHLTWADVVRSFSGGVWSRLLCFHAANGFVSLFGNVALAWALVKWMRCLISPRMLQALWYAQRSTSSLGIGWSSESDNARECLRCSTARASPPEIQSEPLSNTEKTSPVTRSGASSPSISASSPRRW